MSHQFYLDWFTKVVFIEMYVEPWVLNFVNAVLFLKNCSLVDKFYYFRGL